MYPKPFYRVFISRGLSVEDRVHGHGDDQLLKPVNELGHELFKCRAVKGICKLIDEIVSIQRPKDAVPLTPCVVGWSAGWLANREPPYVR